MRLGTLRRTRQRAARAVAGLVAAFLLTGNVLAAAGLCVVKAPVQPAAVQVADEGTDTPCTQHLVDEGAAGSTQSKHHCPAEDPTAQSRTGDLPSPQLMVAFVAVLLPWSSTERLPGALIATDDPSEPRPLYARLQRLRL